MRHVTFYEKTTGRLNGVSLLVKDDAAVALNTPAGHEAIDHPSGKQFDHCSQRVDLVTGKVIDFIPEPPGPGIEWDTKRRRWEPTQEARRVAELAISARQQIAALEVEQRALLVALILDLTQSNASPDAIRFRAIDTEIKALRAKR